MSSGLDQHGMGRLSKESGLAQKWKSSLGFGAEQLTKTNSNST